MKILNPYGIIFITGGSNLVPDDDGSVLYRYAQIIVPIHHPEDRHNARIRIIPDRPGMLEYTFGAFSHALSSVIEISSVQSAIENSIQEQNEGNNEYREKWWDERVDRMEVLLGMEYEGEGATNQTVTAYLMLPNEVAVNGRSSQSFQPMIGSNMTWQSEIFSEPLPRRNGELHRHYGYVERSQVVNNDGAVGTRVFPIGDGVRRVTEQRKKPTRMTAKEVKDANEARVKGRSPPRGTGGN